MSPGFNLDDYEPVADRIAHFWKDHPDGRIITSPVLQLSTGGQWVFLAEVYRGVNDITPTATGYAEEQTGEGMVNRSAALENCETSAIGRALANLGYSTSKSRASREEMEKVQANEESPQDRALLRLTLRFGREEAIDIWNAGAEKGWTPDQIVDEALANRKPEIDHGPHTSGAEPPPDSPSGPGEEVVEPEETVVSPSDPPAPTTTPEDPGEAWEALVGHLDWHPDVRNKKDDIYQWTRRLFALMAATQLWPEDALTLTLDKHHPDLEPWDGRRHLSSLKKDDMLRLADMAYLEAKQKMAESRV